MKVFLVFLIAIFNGYQCQVYYHPVQVLIPTFNGTNLATNHTIYNYTNTGGVHPQNQIQNWNKSQVYNGSYDGHLLLGVIQPSDRLLYNQEFDKPKRWWTYREKIIEYPKDLTAGYSRHETISALRIYNKFLDGHGAKATILDGGIGRQYAKIRLASPFGKGLRYAVQIYGR